jgi:hypothetical protein
MPINKNIAPSRAGRMILETTTAALAATASRKRTKSCLLSLVAALGLAIFSNPAHAQQQPGIDIGTHGRFQIWRTTTLGSYKGVDSYRDALDAAKMKIGDAADEILGRPTFHYAKEKSEVELALLSAAELGIESESSLAEVYRRATQLGLALCPGEVGPQLRLDYREQPRGESLTIAMEPVKTYDGNPTILSLMNFGHGLALVGSDGRPEFRVPRYFRFVFALPGKRPLEARRDSR